MPRVALLPLLFAAAFLAGLIDSIAGGGGLITVPVLLGIGLPPQAALGTNKLQGREQKDEPRPGAAAGAAQEGAGGPPNGTRRGGVMSTAEASGICPAQSRAPEMTAMPSVRSQ